MVAFVGVFVFLSLANLTQVHPFPYGFHYLIFLYRIKFPCVYGTFIKGPLPNIAAMIIFTRVSTQSNHILFT